MNDVSTRELLAAVREACSPDVWSRGVELARAGRVHGESVTDEEVRLRIAIDGALVSPAVVLWPSEQDWFCDCSAGGDVCEHIAAGVIALRRASQSGQSLPTPRQGGAGRLSYRFTRTPQGLSFDRFVVLGDKAERLPSTLAAVVSGRVSGPKFAATQVDLAVEAALTQRLSGVLPWQSAGRLFDALAQASDVQLDNQPIKVGGVVPPMRAVVEDCAEGFRVRIEQNPIIDEIFANGLVRCGDTLRVLGDPNLTARELEELRAGRIVGRESVAELLTDLLPSLRERLPVHVETKELPQVTSELRPRLLIESWREEDRLCVLPSIVYGDPPVARLDGERLTHLGGDVPLRWREAEQNLQRRLERVLGVGPGRRLECAGEQAVELASKLKQLQARNADVRGDSHQQFFVAPALRAHFSVHGQSFYLTFESVDEQSGERRTADARAVMRAWARGESLVALSGGGFAPLPADWLSRYGARIADLLAAREMLQGELPSYMLPDLAKVCEMLEQPAPPELGRLRALLDGGFERIQEQPLPADLKAVLRDYQRQGVQWLKFLRTAGMGAMLADDMGLGKTLQALCAMEGRTLVVAPTSVLHNWAIEIERFRPSLRTNVYHGMSRKLDPQADVTLTTYALLRLDAEQLEQQSWDMVVLDEAQAIKNPDSQVARAAYRLRAKFRVTLSGTPVENRLDELWSQMHFLNPGLLGGRQDFQDRYAKAIVDGTPGAAARLRERTRPFVLRRRKAEVAKELPERTEVVLRCTLSDAERAVYESVRAAMVPGVVQKLREGGSVMAALEALLRLRQACCHPALVPGQQAESSSKIELLIERLEHGVAAGHKALVFSQWTSLLDLVEPHLRQNSLAYVRLDGATRDRQSVVEAFQAEDGPPVMLVSLKAGGTGLNLTAADHVVLLDPWWNPAVEDQAADRAHRIGQQRPVLVQRMVAEDTVEERILALQEHKRAVAEAALGGADQAVSLTRDDLLAILD